MSHFLDRLTWFRREQDTFSEGHGTPDLFEVSHILIEPVRDDANGWAVAQAQARAIAQTVGNDPGAFAEAPRAHSACPSAQQDGGLGQVRRGEPVPPVRAAIEVLAQIEGVSIDPASIPGGG